MLIDVIDEDLLVLVLMLRPVEINGLKMLDPWLMNATVRLPFSLFLIAHNSIICSILI